MSASHWHRDLRRVEQYANRWAALTVWGFGLAAVVAGLWLASLADLLGAFQRGGRVMLCGSLAAISLAALVWGLRFLRRRRTPAGVAVLVERYFPKLDNHLINVVQLSDAAGDDPLAQAYVAGGVPGWRALDWAPLREPRRLRWLACALCAALLPWLLSLALAGPRWSIAARRVLNPWSSLAPAAAVQLLAVSPGDAVVTQGEPLTLACEVRGRPGIPILLEWEPAHDRPQVVNLGTTTGNPSDRLVHVMPRVSDGFRYRFKAGDAPPSARYRVQVRESLAFASVAAQVVPEPYTGLPDATVDLFAARLAVPQYARLRVKVTCNRALAGGFVGVEGGASTALVTSGASAEAALSVASGHVVRVTAVDADGGTVAAAFPFELIPDRAPTIRITTPMTRVSLAPGGAPRIEFEAEDDYGLTELALERVERRVADGVVSNAVRLQAWPVSAARGGSQGWVGLWSDVLPGAAFRIVAVDNRVPEGPNRSVSPPVIFELGAAAGVSNGVGESAAEALASLAGLIELQTRNLDCTRALEAAVATAERAAWNETRETQARIRRLAGGLIADPRRPLGELRSAVRRAYDGPMLEAIDTLERITAYQPGERKALTPRAVALERQVLDLLIRTQAGLASVQDRRAATELLALLEAVIKGQREALETVRGAVARALTVPTALAERQDALASDLAEFVATCRAEAERQAKQDAAFAEAARATADLEESRKVRRDMLLAAEQIEGRSLAAAVPAQIRALEGLQAMHALLDRWRVAKARAQTETAREELATTRGAVEKLVEIQATVVEALKALPTQQDQSGNEVLEITEENAELKGQMELALAKIANDLQVLPNLPVGNELVEDVSQIYEEVKQVAGSEASPASELGLQKEDWILDALALQSNRLDDMEMWLVGKPDNVKRNTETFDQQELPAIALVPLQEQFEDIIGDLLEQQEEIAEESDDSVGNQGAADLPAGWGIAEGEFTDYSAKGKSGNERPEHKDQDGRSGVGREGMSDGEIAAASGKINEGDKNIENRMTRDPAQGGQIAEDDHAQAKATGGGKISGYAEGEGMFGEGPRRDSTSDKPSPLGWQAMLRRSAETQYARATMGHIRSGDLDQAIYHMRQAEDAMQEGQPIRQVREFQQRAAAALRETQVELSGAFADITLDADARQELLEGEQIASPVDEAPSRYRGLVSEYFKALSEGPP